MKKTVLFALSALFLMSCGGKGVAPDDYITWGQAFQHVSKSASYWILVGLAAGVLIWYCIGTTRSANGWNGTSLGVFCFLVAVLAFAIFFRVSEVATGTTVEQAKRGAWIGY